MKAKVIDGKETAAQIRSELEKEVANLQTDRKPGLAVILVGEDPASEVYVRNKGRACEKAGIQSLTKKLPAETSQEALLAEIDRLNNDDAYHGILVQLPLPKHIDPQKIIEAIDRKIIIICHWSIKFRKGTYKNLINTVRAATFGTIVKNKVTVVGDPS